MKKMTRSFTFIALLFMFVVTLAACQYDEDVIVFAEGDWESVEFHDQVAKFIIENGYDIKVEISLLDTPLTIASLINGSAHVNMEMWTDNVATYRDDLAAGYYEEISTNFSDTFQGLYIPQYLADAHPGLRTIQDLPDFKHLFPDPEQTYWNPDNHKAVVYGGPSGWAATNFLVEKFTNEDLYPGLVEHFEFRPSESTTLMNTVLVSAYNDGIPYVGYNWEPTWVMGDLDMYLLDDELEFDISTGSGNLPSQPVTIVVTAGFQEDYPEVYAFLSNYAFAEGETSAALSYMNANEASAEETAIWWLTENVDIWGEWVPEDVKTKVLDALA